jgi:hypothetical protein
VLEVGKRYESPRTGTWVEVVERRDQGSGQGMIEIDDEMPLLQILVIANG